MNKNTLISLEESLQQYHQYSIEESELTLPEIDYGREGIVSAIGELLKSIAELFMSVIVAIKNIIIKISRYIGYKLLIVSSNCRHISSHKGNRAYRTAINRIIFSRGISYERYKRYTTDIILLINRIHNLIGSSNLYKQISDILDLQKSDDGNYLPPIKLPITPSTYLGMQDLCSNLGLEIVPITTVQVGDVEVWETCEIRNSHIFKSYYKENITLSGLGYDLDRVLDIYKNYYTKLYDVTPVINDYIDNLTEVRNRINTVINRGIGTSISSNKVIRLKLIAKNVFICSQIYIAITNLLIEPMNYFTEFTNIIKNIQTN